MGLDGYGADLLELAEDLVRVLEEILTEEKVGLERSVFFAHFGEVFVEPRRYRAEVLDVPGDEGVHRLELRSEDIDGVFCGLAFLEVLAEGGSGFVVILEVQELHGFWGWLAEQYCGYVDEPPFLRDHCLKFRIAIGDWLPGRGCRSGCRGHCDEGSGWWRTIE